MTDKKSVLVVGLDPRLIDFTQPGYPPGMDAAKVFAGIKSSEEELTRLGYSVQTCMTDFGETAEAVVLDDLKKTAMGLHHDRCWCKNRSQQLLVV